MMAHEHAADYDDGEPCTFTADNGVVVEVRTQRVGQALKRHLWVERAGYDDASAEGIAAAMRECATAHSLVIDGDDGQKVYGVVQRREGFRQTFDALLPPGWFGTTLSDPHPEEIAGEVGFAAFCWGVA